MFCIKLPGKDLVIYWFHYLRFSHFLPTLGVGCSQVLKYRVWILREVPKTRGGQNNLSLGTECSLINCRDASSHPMRNSIWLHTYHACLERRWRRHLGSSLCCKNLSHTLLYSLFVGLWWRVRYCGHNVRKSAWTGPPLKELFSLEQYFSLYISSSTPNLKIEFP